MQAVEIMIMTGTSLKVAKKRLSLRKNIEIFMRLSAFIRTTADKVTKRLG